jgi:hypothetical protein
MPRLTNKKITKKAAKREGWGGVSAGKAKSTKDWKHRAVDDAKVTAAFNRAVNP